MIGGEKFACSREASQGENSECGKWEEWDEENIEAGKYDHL